MVFGEKSTPGWKLDVRQYGGRGITGFQGCAIDKGFNVEPGCLRAVARFT